MDHLINSKKQTIAPSKDFTPQQDMQLKSTLDPNVDLRQVAAEHFPDKSLTVLKHRLVELKASEFIPSMPERELSTSDLHSIFHPQQTDVLDEERMFEPTAQEKEYDLYNDPRLRRFNISQVYSADSKKSSFGQVILSI